MGGEAVSQTWERSLGHCGIWLALLPSSHGLGLFTLPGKLAETCPDIKVPACARLPACASTVTSEEVARVWKCRLHLLLAGSADQSERGHFSPRWWKPGPHPLSPLSPFCPPSPLCSRGSRLGLGHPWASADILPSDKNIPSAMFPTWQTPHSLPSPGYPIPSEQD